MNRAWHSSSALPHAPRRSASRDLRRGLEIDMGGKKLCRDVPEVLTIAKVAAMFGRKPRTVRGWIADGLLPHLKIGRSVFVPADALAEMVANAATRAERKPAKTDVAKATVAAVRKPRDDNPLE
jgi:hypothetical protein